ncbi:MAG: [Fe-Fe] hydrogenase large subunit C-terminal domain-containing protein, partial [Acutalibacteraceae bacterium]|nr:[Fe-Fe] hydrogenase large subunit C-terminal domain-containing protein [Acutalibacteraceae bacterium]
VQNGGVLPLITSCSPGWIRYCEQFYPDMLDNLSSCKSPQQMFGAGVKTYYAEKNGIDPKDIFSVSVMPCTAKKYEIARDDQSAAGVPDLDATITTRELARMIKKARIQFTKLPDEQFDNPLGEDTGAAVIFGATGGVMEAALRTAVDTLTGKDNESYEFTEVRGMEGVKEATYDVAGLKINVAVASGTDNAKKVLDAVKSGEKNYHFIEIMGCPGGCINGGGQPIHSQAEWATIDIKGLRAKALYDQDASMPIRKSHQNPMIKTIYDEYFEKPGSHKAHEILHTSYKAQTNTIK